MSTENIMIASASHHEAVDPLTLWYRQYLGTSAMAIWKHNPVIQALQSDELDHNQIELEVQRLSWNADVLRGFCGKCRRLLDHWPNASEEALGDQKARTFALGSAVHTREIEAAARAGCKFCMFLFSRLRQNSELDLFRKVERRLNLLGKVETTTLSIEVRSDRDYQILWLNYPQKMAPESNYVSANVCLTHSERVSPTCEY